MFGEAPAGGSVELPIATERVFLSLSPAGDPRKSHADGSIGPGIERREFPRSVQNFRSLA
jgi:hypothetical protein